MSWIKEYIENEFNWIPTGYLSEPCYFNHKDCDLEGFENFDPQPLMADYVKWRNSKPGNGDTYRSDLIAKHWQGANVGYDDAHLAMAYAYDGDECIEDYDHFICCGGTHPQDNPEPHFQLIFNTEGNPPRFECYVEFWEWNAFNGMLFSSTKKDYAQHNSTKPLRCSFKEWCLMKVAYIAQAILDEEIEKIQRDAEREIWEKKKELGIIPEALIAPEPVSSEGDEDVLPF